MLRPKIWLPVIGILGLALWLGYELRPRLDRTAAKPVVEAGRNVLAGTDPREGDLSPLEQMRWVDVAVMVDEIGRDSPARNRVIAETAGSTQPPVRYLRGLLLLSKGDATGAAKQLAEISAADIPAEHLYAPYRLYEISGRPEQNPYREPLRRAVTAGQTSPMVAARVMGREGDLSGALAACLRSDPEQWTSQDLDLFAALRRHSGHSAEAITLFKAALKSGRVREAMRKPLIALVSQEGERVAVAEFESRLAELTRPGSPVRQPLKAAVEKQFQLRDRFLRRDYAGLIDTYRAAEAILLPDETLLLLVLSSAQLSASPEFSRWSSELRRRFPDPSVATWLQTLLPPLAR